MRSKKSQLRPPKQVLAVGLRKQKEENIKAKETKEKQGRRWKSQILRR